ncbi:MAG: HlyD family efflux transporter periplasmic adaptor subunit [Methylacidiphilales bacterium]|nr:HlyD family efflux transporter periplasmic adaptor subunit [Candidatus Methylacidiphilales bacterium]NJR15334.1 HlyD family efflux transporter periplasmic adaptor subunit [Calothrix sp. CSU_2_0]
MTKLDNYQQNGRNSHKNHEIGTKLLKSKRLITETKTPESPVTKLADNTHQPSFEQSVVLRQSPVWSRAIMGTLVGLACFGIAWASIAKIEQAIPAVGQLKPQGSVKEIQASVGGVVKQVYVKDGQKVKSGDLLLIFDSTATSAELKSLLKIQAGLMQENQIYRRLIQDNLSVAASNRNLGISLSQEANSILKTRTALLAENQLLRRELTDSNNISGLGSDEQTRLQTARIELDSRASVSRLEIEKIRRLLAQNAIKIIDTQSTLVLETEILGKLQTLSREGAIAQLQYLQQQNKVKNLTAQVAQLLEEQKRLQFDIQQGQQEVKNTVAVSQKNILEKITTNKNKIAEIESQFTKILLDNEKQLAEINSKISQVQLNAKYQELHAPIAGTIFDLKAGDRGFVTRASEKLLSIVPDEQFIAEAYITNKDIGFVREGMKVDVRIDSFPFSEFGGIKGEIASIGSDALPPDENYRYYRFPTKIKLNQQSLDVKGRKISLQSGMSITANIKIREERSAISLFTELFTKQIESLNEVR